MEKPVGKSVMLLSTEQQPHHSLSLSLSNGVSRSQMQANGSIKTYISVYNGERSSNG